MDLLDRVLGPDKKNQFQDLIDRFQRGSPYDSIDDREATDRYSEIAPQLTRDQYRDSAAEAFNQLSPDERREFSQWLRTRASERGLSVQDYDLNDDGIDDRMQQDPGELAEMTTRVREREPNIFEQILGKGGTGGRFDNPIAKIAVAGIAAMAASRLMGRR